MPAEGEVRLQLLGPIELLCEGQPIVLGGPIVRQLFVQLALSPGAPVTHDRLVVLAHIGSSTSDPIAALYHGRRAIGHVGEAALCQLTADAAAACSPGPRSPKHGQSSKRRWP